jgi:hypothetical protein
MEVDSQGLTGIYQRFHDPDDRSPGIVGLREQHETLDRLVLSAYGWGDLPVIYEFLLDYESEGAASALERRRPWRYRWPDELRDTLLARLLRKNVDALRVEADHANAR